MKKVREELNRISNDRFHNRKIKYAINIRKDEITISIIQIFFDEIECDGSLIFLWNDNQIVCSFKKEIFKLKFNHYQDFPKECIMIHYDFYI